jgi:hypothetical protein
MQQATTIAFFFRLMHASRLHAVFLVHPAGEWFWNSAPVLLGRGDQLM